MSEVKPGWRRVRIGEIVERYVERVDSADGYTRFVGVEHFDSGDIRLRRYGDVNHDALPPTFRYSFRAGMVLLPTRRPRLRKCAVAPFDGLTGEKILVLVPKPDSGLHPLFTPFLLSSDRVQSWNVEKEVGSVTPHFRWSDLASCEVVLPPWEKQEQAIAMFSCAQASAEAMRALHAAAADVRRAWLNNTADELCERSHIVRPLIKCLSGPIESGCSAPEREEDTGHMVLSLAALDESGYCPGQLKAVDPTPKMKAASLSDGDLLISRSNTLSRVGFIGRYRDEGRPVSFPDTMMRLPADEGEVTPEYLELILQSVTVRRAIQGIAAGTSASMKKINKKNLAALPVPVPDFRLQADLVDQYAALRAAEASAISRVTSSISLLAALVNEVMRE